MAYITLKPLDKHGEVIPVQTMTRLDWLNPAQRDRLVQVRAVREVQSPPLAELAGWVTRAGKLDAIGIVTLEQFIDGETKEIAKCLGQKAATVEKWKEELSAWFTQPSAVKRRG
jgi:hypothetical protein